MTNLKVGLVGAGVFGGYHANKLVAYSAAEFVGVFDPDARRCADLAAAHNTAAYDDVAALFVACDAIMVACPAIYHEQVVGAALEAGCHVLVEKPLALTGAAAKQLADLADSKGLILQVGHQERFVLAAMGLFDIAERPIKIEAIRMSPPAPDGRAGDVSVIWDLMIHDLDMVGKLMGDPVAVSSIGKRSHTQHIDAVTTTLSFADGEAEISASRCAPARDRKMKLTYPNGTIAINFLDRSVENTTPFEIIADVSGRMPDPLEAADFAFFAACMGERDCAIPGREAAVAVSIAERAEQTTLDMIGT
ncbi:MAG: scyllo-inositol 2-dehydrogenase (NAD(+)) [Hyphomonas sp. TMED17]|nr:MAG: scyllo-inositol 2-dehydrogenase (NAD(+)) [Hyphomonas sp. TMED17]